MRQKNFAIIIQMYIHCYMINKDNFFFHFNPDYAYHSLSADAPCVAEALA